MRKAKDTREEIRDYFRNCIGETFYTPTERRPFDIVDVTDYIIMCKPHRSKRPEPKYVYISDMGRIYYWLMSSQDEGPKNSNQVSEKLLINIGSASYLMPLMDEYFKYIQLQGGKIFYNPTGMDMMF